MDWLCNIFNFPFEKQQTVETEKKNKEILIEKKIRILKKIQNKFHEMNKFTASNLISSKQSDTRSDKTLVKAQLYNEIRN